ncbi:MAG: 2-dehydropantoate 2-reductase N-terminal domain-containing protein [Candidatus Omnitrophota bacterium]
MNILIYGAGAIGCHIAYCMYVTRHTPYLIARGQHYEQMKKYGMHIKICDNEILKDEKFIKEDSRFYIVNDVNKVKDTKMDYIFITVKLNDYNDKTLQDLYPFMGKDTAVIPPCTELPFWWFYDLNGKSNEKYKDIDFNPEVSRYFIRENIIGMTMWLSSVIESPGHVCVKHVQRGYPLKELYPNMKERAEKLRSIFQITCMSPVVDNIRSEIFIKSINAFAFNLVALDRECDNVQLSHDKYGQDCIRKIMIEGEQILRILNIPVIQEIEDRITQTLSSTKHTMSMLHDYRMGKQIELSALWQSFDSFCKILGINMGYSRDMYEKVMAKISAKKHATVLKR